MKHFFFLALMCCLVSSCMVTRHVNRAKEYGEKYRGATYLDIANKFGIPTRIEPDGNKGRFLIYEEEGAEVSQTTYGLDKQSSSTSSWRESEYLQFHMNESDICDAVLTNHTRPEKHFSVKKTLVGILLTTSPFWILLGCRVIGDFGEMIF